MPFGRQLLAELRIYYAITIASGVDRGARQLGKYRRSYDAVTGIRIQ